MGLSLGYHSRSTSRRHRVQSGPDKRESLMQLHSPSRSPPPSSTRDRGRSHLGQPNLVGFDATPSAHKTTLQHYSLYPQRPLTSHLPLSIQDWGRCSVSLTTFIDASTGTIQSWPTHRVHNMIFRAGKWC